VVNFHARDTIDNEVVSSVLERLDVIVRQMSSVGVDEREAADVMGELLERLDIRMLLEEARHGVVSRTQERIDAALEQARQAKLLQDDLMRATHGFGGGEWQSFGNLKTWNLAVLIQRAAPLLGIEIELPSTDGESFALRLPESMRGRFPEFGNRTIISVTTRRADRIPANVVLLDFSTSFVRHVVAAVAAPEFGGGYAAMDARPFGTRRQLAAYVARFQNDQGEPQGASLLLIARHDDGTITLDNSVAEHLFEWDVRSAQCELTDPSAKRMILDSLRDRAEAAMSAECTRFRHPNDLNLVAAIDLV
jgi:hypothetical protein